MDRVQHFIKKHQIQYSWKGAYLQHFIVRIPFLLLKQFINATDILKYTKYNIINNCGLVENGVCIDMIECFSEDEIIKYFPKECD